ncbi:hypothetical protein IQ07DRAFT_19445 [Pyrenochaeta sp. DS3sAY3a]|nr:hypothetical protein IQ07DRAFT_19445 [Pyrenochaeta sp. DS3sAY3a]
MGRSQLKCENARLRRGRLEVGVNWRNLERGTIGEVRESSTHFTMVSLFNGVRYIPFRSKRTRHTFLTRCTCMPLDTIIIIFFLK